MSPLSPRVNIHTITYWLWVNQSAVNPNAVYCCFCFCCCLVSQANQCGSCFRCKITKSCSLHLFTINNGTYHCLSFPPGSCLATSNPTMVLGRVLLLFFFYKLTGSQHLCSCCVQCVSTLSLEETKPTDFSAFFSLAGVDRGPAGSRGLPLHCGGLQLLQEVL